LWLVKSNFSRLLVIPVCNKRFDKGKNYSYLTKAAFLNGGSNLAKKSHDKKVIVASYFMPSLLL